MSNLYLAHHGIKGQKWGVRRYQNPDGTLTDAGRRKYSKKATRLKDARDIFRGREKTAKVFAKPAGIASGVLSGISSANSTFTTAIAPYTVAALAGKPVATAAAFNAIKYSSIMSGAGVGLAVGGAVYGSYKGIQAVNRLVADHCDRKYSEVTKKVN